MPFTDVIDNYANGTTGTLTTSDGGSVGYSVSGNASTISRAGTDRGARINGNGTQTTTVNFDDTVHGMTISVNRSNPGEEYFIEIDGVQIDLNTAIANGDVSFTQGGAATHFITATGGISSSGSPTNGSLGFLHFQSPVNSVRIFGTGGSTGNFDLFDIGIDSADFRVVCFTQDTQIMTPSGPRRANQLQAGDIVSTLDQGACEILQTNVRPMRSLQLMREERLRPILIKAGALGNGLPTHDLRVSRQHRMLVSSKIAMRFLGVRDVLIQAIHLVGLPGIEMCTTLKPLHYIHFLLEDHQVLIANGAPAESLFTGAQTAMQPARPFPTPPEFRAVFDAHKRHDRALLECFEPPSAILQDQTPNKHAA